MEHIVDKSHSKSKLDISTSFYEASRVGVNKTENTLYIIGNVLVLIGTILEKNLPVLYTVIILQLLVYFTLLIDINHKRNNIDKVIESKRKEFESKVINGQK